MWRQRYVDLIDVSYLLQSLRSSTVMRHIKLSPLMCGESGLFYLHYWLEVRTYFFLTAEIDHDNRYPMGRANEP